ncbi:tyrosine-type recombinase/integrase [Luteimonas sp. BDR2-5]|uniref:tyrosine-type recombinase/integrase n=1 Tax=Proluteimonas luteida TaxID=2878685 RepID=UPI001E4C58F6|nr:tyrosine-type recombinase/integrase [Luteimonas sp. BDR2-5]MCD9027734.1 tyrosine-type recombinase/integrase [Luteimonas sp. BDR2-5]
MLTDTAIRRAKNAEKPQKLADAAGLYLLLPSLPSEGKWWRFDYRFAGKRKTLSMGVYPAVTLREARDKRDKARALLREGADPGATRKAAKGALVAAHANTFAAVRDEWSEMQAKTMSPVTVTKSAWLFDFASDLDDRPIADIKPAEVLAVLRAVESKGRHETAHRVKQRLGQVFRYAVATGRAERDPTADLRGALAPIPSKSHAAIIDPGKIRGLLLSMDGYDGEPLTRAALQLSALTFQRPGNIRAMEWSEIDFDAAEWRIPAEKMKMKDAHVVPLSEQAIAILREIQPLSARSRYVFPSLRSADRCLSENTLNAALRRLGYSKDEMTAHGFRATASSRLNEMGWNTDVIERQLAHAERNKVRAVYNRAQYMAERQKMMQAWADYLDALKAGSNVTLIGKRAG